MTVTLIGERSRLRDDLRELWGFRHLLYSLAARDISVRYKQTVLGAAWAILQPAMTMLLFLFLFGRVAKVPTDGLPYPLFCYCGLIPWQLFSFSLSEASNSLVLNQNLIKKVYFPRVIALLSPLAVALVDCAVSFLLLFGLMVYYRRFPSFAGIAMMIPFLLGCLLVAFAVSLWLAPLNLIYRDFRYVIPFLTQLWLYATPVAYPRSAVPTQWQGLFALNPMGEMVEGFRWALLGSNPPDTKLLAISFAGGSLLILSGLAYFRRMERDFADWV